MNWKECGKKMSWFNVGTVLSQNCLTRSEKCYESDLVSENWTRDLPTTPNKNVISAILLLPLPLLLMLFVL
jgi:hypothetical protein